MAMDSTKAMSGSFGKAYDANGNWMTNIFSIEAGGEISKEEVKRSGTRTTGHKVVGITYSGSMTGYKVTNQLAKYIAQVADDTKASPVSELVYKLDDPDNHEGRVWVRLKGVQYDNIPVLKSEHGSLVEEETPFTYTGFEFLD